MRVLHLFAGAGGGCLADKLTGHTAVGYVEWEPYCQKVLQARIADGLLDSAPIFGDAREFVSSGYAREYRGVADVVAGGFPCPVNSQAAHGNNTADDLWPATADCIRVVRPEYVFLENVVGILARGRTIRRVLGDLATLGYDCRWDCLPAASVGAPHFRPRVWILGRDPHGNGKSVCPVNEETPRVPLVGWPLVSEYLRVGDGPANRMDRLRACGNAQVPAVAATAWRLLGGPIA